MSLYDEYCGKYRNIAFVRRSGVVQMRLHKDGGPLTWGSSEGSTHAQLSDAFHDLSRDPDLRALILTGTGEVFCIDLNPHENPTQITATNWARLRAWALGAAFESKPLIALRNTRPALTRRIRRELNDDLDLGLALEGLGLLSLRDGR